jgi:alpha-1,3-rhamnosyl/mannosyltransferase
MLKFCIDAREAFRPAPTGKGLFTAHIIRELVRRGIPLTLLLEKRSRHFPMLCAEGTKIVTFSRGVRWHIAAARFLKTWKGIYLSPTSFLVPALLRGNIPIAIVIHDLIAFHHEPLYQSLLAWLGAPVQGTAHDRKAKIIERLTLPRALKTARYIFCVSEATKCELLERFRWVDEQKITVIYEGITISMSHPYHLPPNTFPYILSIGTLCPRKNQLRLIEAFRMLPEKVRENTKLILVGPRGWHDGDIVSLAKKTLNVQWRGYVSDVERIQLLSSATVFAYPSLAEGFGLPVLDALSLGIPTLTSNAGSLPEVAGDAALLVNPENTEDIARGLERLLTDETLRTQLKEKGPKQSEKFSWERTVDLMLEALCRES